MTHHIGDSRSDNIPSKDLDCLDFLQTQLAGIKVIRLLILGKHCPVICYEKYDQCDCISRRGAEIVLGISLPTPFLASGL